MSIDLSQLLTECQVYAATEQSSFIIDETKTSLSQGTKSHSHLCITLIFILTDVR